MYEVRYLVAIDHPKEHVASEHMNLNTAGRIRDEMRRSGNYWSVWIFNTKTGHTDYPDYEVAEARRLNRIADDQS